MNRKVIAVTVNIEDDNKIVDSKKDIENKIFELENLIEAIGDETVINITQNKNKIDKSYYIGKGKALEIKDYCQKLSADLVVFNNELTGSQVKI